MTSPEKPQFTGPGDEWQARREDARLNAEIDEWEDPERRAAAQHIRETRRFLDWIGGMLSRHAVGKEIGRHLDQSSTIHELIEFAERDAAEEIDGRHNYKEGNKILDMVSRLKDEKLTPSSEIKYVGILHDLLRAQLDENEKNLKELRAQQRPK
ncbi:MAG: hypothetical protein HYV25_01545 [Candidatus Harrisonbacteria bacterium]|nr:hypothetical protein [Candidatus Harrisonbacteria bacterium]